MATPDAHAGIGWFDGSFSLHRACIYSQIDASRDSGRVSGHARVGARRALPGLRAEVHPDTRQVPPPLLMSYSQQPSRTVCLAVSREPCCAVEPPAEHQRAQRRRDRPVWITPQRDDHSPLAYLRSPHIPQPVVHGTALSIARTAQHRHPSIAPLPSHVTCARASQQSCTTKNSVDWMPEEDASDAALGLCYLLLGVSPN